MWSLYGVALPCGLQHHAQRSAPINHRPGHIRSKVGRAYRKCDTDVEATVCGSLTTPKSYGSRSYSPNLNRSLTEAPQELKQVVIFPLCNMIRSNVKYLGGVIPEPLKRLLSFQMHEAVERIDIGSPGDIIAPRISPQPNRPPPARDSISIPVG